VGGGGGMGMPTCVWVVCILYILGTLEVPRTYTNKYTTRESSTKLLRPLNLNHIFLLHTADCYVEFHTGDGLCSKKKKYTDICVPIDACRGFYKRIHSFYDRKGKGIKNIS
jgi:hypothetical protein